jgi:hypothetical protein
MPVTYTNRKGRKYYLCQGVTKSGKPRYYFSREQKDKLVDEIPEGYEITESVNGIVSLSKFRPKLLSEQEIAIVEAAIKNHPQGKRYRLSVKSKELTIYEQVGPDLQEIATMMVKELGLPGVITEDFNRRMEEEHNIYAQYTPVMKFVLSDKANRLFRAERMCYLGSVDDWINIGYNKTIEELANELVPTLGTDAFFELF